MLRDKGVKALRLLQYMSGKKWGLNAKHRRLLYLNYILPKFTYGEEVFSLASKSNLKMLDIIHNQALRLITKTIKTTKTELLSILANTDTLEVRRTKNKVLLFSRLALNVENPANKIFKKNKIKDPGINRLGKRKSFVQSTLEITKLCNIKKTMITSYPKPFPLWTLDQMNIDTSLSTIINKKKSSTALMKNTSENHIFIKYPYHK